MELHQNQNQTNSDCLNNLLDTYILPVFYSFSSFIEVFRLSGINF